VIAALVAIVLMKRRFYRQHAQGSPVSPEFCGYPNTFSNLN
jgi:hypothetical protein